MPELHDAALKRLCDFPLMVMHALLGFAPKALAARLDLSTLKEMSAEYVGRDLRRSRGDKVWRARFRGGGPGDCLYLALMLEFQSAVDCYMAARVAAYTGQIYQRLSV